MGSTDLPEPWPREQVHLWIAAPEESGRVDSMFDCLAPDERERARRFRFISDRNRFIVRHGIARHILGTYLGIDAEGVELGRGAHGKPRIVTRSSESALRFSQSHSRGCALIAVAERREIGVDCEAVRVIADADAIVSDFGSESERAAYDRTSREERPEAFAIWWTRKEAFIKAIGTGLAFSLRSFDVSGDWVRILRPEGERETQWSLVTLSPARDYIASLCLEGPALAVRCRQYVTRS